MDLAEVLSRGYFPKELPRPFVTTSFAKAMVSVLPLPGDFASPLKKKIPVAKLCSFSLGRGGLLRRPLSIVNPLHFFLLAREVVDNWDALLPFLSGSKIAATSPEYKKSGRAINGQYAQGQRSQVAIEARINKRFVLQTDVSRFYGSTYTHSIPWALHTKAVAKSDSTLGLLGNRLDYLVRMGQDRQTVGIPIGPDTSLVIGELILQRCDASLLTKIPSLKGFRFIDDYELSFNSRSEAEEAFHLLERCVSDFELSLNPKKTSIWELPLRIESRWASALKAFEFGIKKAAQAASLEMYFSQAYQLHGEFPEEPVLQFAISRTRSLVIDPGNWNLYQRLLLLCIAPEPATLPFVMAQVIARINAGAGPVLAEYGETMNDVILSQARLRHSSEVANALWACLALKLSVSLAAVDELGRCEDSIVALLALHCEAEGLVEKPLDKTLWSLNMTTQGLYDEHWLLSYEANVKGWLPSIGGGDHVAADPNFGYLKAAGVSFYDPTQAIVADPLPIPLPTPSASAVPAQYGNNYI